MPEGVKLSRRFAERVARVVRKVEGLRGPGIQNKADTLRIDINAGRSSGGGLPQRPPDLFWFKITASSQDGSNFRWEYTGNEVEKTKAGYGGWSVKQNATNETLYSSLEDQNSTSGKTYDGVDTDGADYPSGFSPQPIENDTMVLCRKVPLANQNGGFEWWIIATAGAHDGTCT